MHNILWGAGGVFGSVPQAPEERGGGRVGRGGAPDTQPRGPQLDPGPSPNPPAHPRLEAPPRARRSTADTRADWLWQEPIRARPPRPLRASSAPRGRGSPASADHAAAGRGRGRAARRLQATGGGRGGRFVRAASTRYRFPNPRLKGLGGGRGANCQINREECRKRR